MNDCLYNDGLQFECTRCSRCCRHTPGYVFLSSNDLHRLAAATKRSRTAFLADYCREVGVNGFRRISLKEKSNFDCIFWEDEGCIVYESRPFQCASYPFWSANLDSQADWEDVKGDCPGADHGRRHSKEEIDAWLEKHLRQQFLGAEEADSR
ncbi:MAG TPA: YkgJ family cysteine cluster protein [bacterium]|nr:YkgJ family cysteine cluster protein [bacterium]